MEPLLSALLENNDEAIERFLTDPEYDINQGGMVVRYVFLCRTSKHARMIIEHPRFDPNAQLMNEATLLHAAAHHQLPQGVFALLIAHEKLDLTVRDRDGLTAVEYAVLYGDKSLARRIIASGRASSDYRSSYIVRYYQLLWQHRDDPVGTMLESRRWLKDHNTLAADLLALVVFVSDGYLRGESKFFGIVGRLPLELQILVCQRWSESTADSVPVADVRLALWSLSRKYKARSYKVACWFLSSLTVLGLIILGAVFLQDN